MSADMPRPVPMDRHPIALRNYVLPTPSIDAFCEKVQKCVRRRRPGLVVYALPRFGKTYGITYATAMLASEFPRLVVERFLATPIIAHSEGRFYGDLNEAFGHKTPRTGDTGRRFDRLVHMLRKRVDDSGEEQLVIFIDEAQHLTLLEYKWLRDLTNALEKHDIRTVAILVGQHELRLQKDALKNAGATDIVARFMLDEAKFSGLCSADDVMTCLDQYDQSTFPEDSDWSYTRYFFPRAWDNGLRLAASASVVWQCFVEAGEAVQSPLGIEIPMDYFTRAIETLFLDHSAADNDLFSITPVMWTEAIMDSGYLQAYEEIISEASRASSSHD